MNQSKYSFGSPNFIIKSQQSNPQQFYTFNSFHSSSKFPISQLKQPLRLQQSQRQVTFKKLSKNGKFLQDQIQEPIQINKNDITKQKKKKSQRKRLFSQNKKAQIDYQQKKINFNQSSKELQKQTVKSPTQMTTLLKNCKISILSLQQEITEKNLQIKKLSIQKQALSNQIQRMHSILHIYVKQSKNNKIKQEQHPKQTSLINHPSNHSSIQNKQNIKQTQNYLLQIKSFKQQNQKLIQQNQSILSQNLHFKQLVDQLQQQNFSLNQKILKMGKGVGKALSTIKKSNLSQTINNSLLFISDQKDMERRQYGKIITHSLKTDTKSNIQFITPSKNSSQTKAYSIQNSNQTQIKQISSIEFYQQKLSNISIRAKRIDQIQRLQDILNKMQKLSQHQQENNIQILNSSASAKLLSH